MSFARAITCRVRGPDLPPPQVGVHHVALDRTRAHDRHFDDQIVELARAKPRQHRHLRAGLDLENSDRIGAADHVVDIFVLGWNGGQFDRPPMRVADVIMALENIEGAAQA